MAETLKNLQALAWGFKPFDGDLQHVKLFKMPIPYQEALSSIPSRKGEVPPVSSLYDTLAASSHSIIAFEPNSLKREETYPAWFYTTANSSLDTSRLQNLFNKWLEAINHPQYKIKPNTEMHYHLDTLDLNQASFQIQRMVLPNLVARWLLEQDFQLQLAGETHSLRLVPLMSRRYIAELITEPQFEGEDLFSYVMRFYMSQLPYSPQPILLHKTGIRRWAKNKITVLLQRSKSMYLRRAAGYLDKSKRKDVFTRLTVKSIVFGEAVYLGRQSDLLDLLPFEGGLPILNDFLANPSNFYQQALIPIATTDWQNPQVQAGLEPSDHREIFAQLDTAFTPIATALPVLSRVKAGDKRRVQMKLTDVDKQNALGETIRIEILSPHFSKLAKKILHAMGFSDESDVESPVQFCDGEGKLCLEIVKLEDKFLTDTLDADKADDAKIKYILDNYKKATLATGILIELSDYSKGKLKKRDPKQAIRSGMSQTGRVSQFFVPKNEKGGFEHRTKNAIADLLRMLGYRHKPFYPTNSRHDLPAELDIIAFSLIQLNAKKKGQKIIYLPVIADVPFGDPHLRLIIPSATGSAESYPNLYQGIKALANWTHDFSEDNRILNFFCDAMAERASKNPTLLILADQNLRRIFPELEDVSQECLSLYGILENPEIRLVRLRFSEDEDAPFCTPAEPKSKYQGLYAHSEKAGVYYSLQNVGDRYVSSTKRKADNLGDSSVNPSTVLIQLCNLQTSDSAVEWAALVHQLRLDSSHTDIATLFPQPLHDIEAVKKYVPRYQAPNEQEDDINELGEGEE